MDEKIRAGEHESIWAQGRRHSMCDAAPSTSASRQASKKASKQEGKHASKHAGRQAGRAETAM